MLTIFVVNIFWMEIKKQPFHSKCFVDTFATLDRLCLSLSLSFSLSLSLSPSLSLSFSLSLLLSLSLCLHQFFAGACIELFRLPHQLCLTAADERDFSSPSVSGFDGRDSIQVPHFIEIKHHFQQQPSYRTIRYPRHSSLAQRKPLACCTILWTRCFFVLTSVKV